MATDSLSKLSRKHGVKVGAGSLCGVEEVALAVGEIVGHSSIKSVARMKSGSFVSGEGGASEPAGGDAVYSQRTV